MKKFVVTLLMFLVFAVGLPLSVDAYAGCPRHRRYRRSYVVRTYRRAPVYYTRSYVARRAPVYYTRSYVARRTPVYYTRSYVASRPSYYRRHRNIINMAVGTGAGMLLGGLIGGRRGAGIGALTGLGGSALYTYKLRP